MNEALSKAEAAARRALALDPRSAQAGLLLAQVLLQRGNFQDAESLARKALAARPEAQEFQYLLAQSLIEQGRHLEGSDVVALALARPPSSSAGSKVFPGLLEAVKMAAHRLMYWNKFSEAEKMLVTARPHLEDDAEAWFLWGKLMRFLGRLEEAEAAYRRAVRLRPERLLSYLYLGETALLRGKVVEVFKIFTQARRLCPVPPPEDIEARLLRYRLAVAMFDFKTAGKIGDAVLSRSRALEHVEKLMWPVIVDDFDFFARPAGYLERGLAAAASLLLKKGDRSSPWGLYFHLYYYSYTHTDFTAPVRKTLLSDCAKLARLEPQKYGWMRHEAGVCRMRLSDFPAALEDFCAAAEATKPPSWRAQCAAAEACSYMGDLGGALKALAKAEAVAPTDAARDECLSAKAKNLLWAGDYERALASLEGISANSSLRDSYWIKGGALVKLKRYREALDVLERGLAEFPQEDAQVWRLEALYRMGRLDEALREAEALPDKNLYKSALKALALGGRGDTAGMSAEFDRLPPHVVEHVCRSLAVESPQSPRERLTVLEGLLALSRGVRRSGNQTALWMR